MSITCFQDLMPRGRFHGAAKNRPSYSPRGTIWPHGEFSLGYSRSEIDSPLDDRHPADNPEGWLGRGCPEDGGAGVPPALNLSDAPNSHRRPKRGLKGITSYGRQMVKAAGHVMQNLLPGHRYSLLTVTVPPLSADKRTQLVARWSELTRQFLQWLARRLEEQGLPALAVLVTEVQPERVLKSAEGYLHYHVMVPSLPAFRGSWSVHPNTVREWFARRLAALLDVPDLGHVNVNAKPVTGSAVRYLAKYMSKGGDVLAEALKDWGAECCPSTWWNLTATLRGAVKSATRRGEETGYYLESLVNYAFDCSALDEVFDYLRHVELEFDGVKVTVGWRGRLTHEGMQGAPGG